MINWSLKNWVWRILFFLVGPTFVLGQTQTFYEHGYKIENYRIEDGLYDNHVGGIYQAKNGYLWISCPSGFLRYDGVSFKQFNIPKEFRTFDYGDHLNDIIEVNGKIYISSLGGGVYEFDPDKGGFRNYKTQDNAANTALRLVADSLGKVWFGSAKGIHVIQKNDSIRSFTLKTVEKELTALLNSLSINYVLNQSFKEMPYGDIQRFPFSVDNQQLFSIIGNGKRWTDKVWDDDGWIENTKGDTIWRPNLNQHIIGGGSFKYNRTFIDTLTLDAGNYTMVLRNSKNPKPNMYDLWFYGLDFKLPNWDGIKLFKSTPQILTSLENVVQKYEEKDGLMSGLEIGLYKDKKENIWWFSTGEFGQITRENEAIKLKPICNGLNKPACPCRITALADYDDNTLWVVGKIKGEDRKEDIYLGLYNQLDNSFREVKTGFKIRENLMDTRELYVDKQKNLWLGTQFNGVYKLSPPFVLKGEEGEPDLVKFYFNSKDAGNQGEVNSSKTIFNFFDDRNNSLWVGTEWAGLFKINLDRPNFQSVDLSKFLEESNAWNFEEDLNQQVWIGNSDKGLIQYDRVKDSVIIYNNEFKGVKFKKPMVPILKLPNGNIFFSTKEKHIIYNPTLDVVEKELPRLMKGTAQLFYQNFIINDTLAFISSRYIYNFKNGTIFHQFNHYAYRGDTEKENGDFWLNNSGKLTKYRINKNNNEVTALTSNEKEVYISDVVVDKNGKCWAITRFGIVDCFNDNPRDGLISEAEGEPVNFYSSAILDKLGTTWLFSSSGKYKFNTETKELIKVPQLNEINGHTYVRLKENGEILLMGNRNLSFFHPDSLSIDSIPPQIILHSLAYKNKEKTNKIKNLSTSKNIELSYFQNDLNLDYIGINFNNSKEITYAYQLQNHQSDWQNVGNERIARFSNLPSGNYIFKVKAANADGIWSKPKSLKITILPPWWQTWWAYLGYSLLIIGLLYYWYQSLQQKLKREQAHNKELQELNQANQRFVPNDFLQILGKKSIKDLQLGDQVATKMTVLFSDIRDYTPLSESMTPEQNFKFINAYLGRVGPIIKAHGGFISSYLGDGLMALFVNEPHNAIAATIAMQKELENYNRERQMKGLRALKTGMGLNTGDLMLGVIGDEHRYESTVISDAVNTASRMEGLTKVFGAAIILSERMLTGLRGNFPLPRKLNSLSPKSEGDGKSPPDRDFAYRYLGKVKVKGKDKALKIYDLYEGETVAIRQLKAKTHDQFEQGIEHYYQREFGKAAACFKQVLVVNESDKAAQYYLDKSVGYIVNGVSQDWSGVEEMVMK